MATGAHSSISSFDKTGTQYLAATDTFSDGSNPVSVFWNKNDNIKQIIHTSYTKEIPSTISTKNESWAGTQVFSISTDTDAVGNLYLSVVIELDTPEAQLDSGPPKTLTTLLRRPSTKESITDWDLTEPLLHRIRGVEKGSKKPEGVQIGYPNGWREDTTGSQYPRPLDNIHPFMPPEDLPSYPNWDWKPRDFLQLNEIPVNRTTKQTLSEFLSGSSYYGGTSKEFMFNPDMRVSKHSKLELFSDREEYSLGDPRPMSITMNGYYSSTLKESPNYLSHDNLISDSLVEAPYQTTYRPHDLSYIPKYLSHTDSKRLRRTGNEHFHLNPDGTYGLYSSTGVLADDLLTSYLTIDDLNKLVEHYNEAGITSNPINTLTTPSDTRGFNSGEYDALPDFEVSSLFGSQDGKCPQGYPNKVANHTFDKGEYLFTESGEFISENKDNPPDGSYSVGLERIDPIADVQDVSPSHQNEDHYGYATVISKDGNTLVVSQGRMYGCEQSASIQSQVDALHDASRTKAPESNPPDANWPYGEEDSAHTAAWSAALQAGAILFPLNPKRAGKVRVYKKNGDDWVLNKVFSASESNLAAYPQGAKSIKRPGAQEYIYKNRYYESFMDGKFPIISQKTPWAPGCKNHISLNSDGTRLVIGEAGGPNNFITTYDYKGGDNWSESAVITSGSPGINNIIEDYYHLGVYTGDNLYTFGPNYGYPKNPTYGIYPLPESVWGSGFGNNVEMSSDGNILAVTSYMSPASIFKWNSGSWTPMGTGITGVADSISLTDDGKTLVTADFTSHYVYVWDYDPSLDIWVNSDWLPLIAIPDYSDISTGARLFDDDLSAPWRNYSIDYNPWLDNAPLGSVDAGVLISEIGTTSYDWRSGNDVVLMRQPGKGSAKYDGYPNQSPYYKESVITTITPISSSAAALAPPVTTSIPNIPSAAQQALYDAEQVAWDANGYSADYIAAEAAADVERRTGIIDDIHTLISLGPGIGGDVYNSVPARISGDGSTIAICGARVKRTPKRFYANRDDGDLTLPENFEYFPQELNIYTKKSSLPGTPVLTAGGVAPDPSSVIPRVMLVQIPYTISRALYGDEAGEAVAVDSTFNVTDPLGNTFQTRVYREEWIGLDYLGRRALDGDVSLSDWTSYGGKDGDFKEPGHWIWVGVPLIHCNWLQEMSNIRTVEERTIARNSVTRQFRGAVDNGRMSSEERAMRKRDVELAGAHKLSVGRSEFSISTNGKRISVGCAATDVINSILPQFPPQLMLSGTKQQRLVAEIPMTSGWARTYYEDNVEALWVEWERIRDEYDAILAAEPGAGTTGSSHPDWPAWSQSRSAASSALLAARRAAIAAQDKLDTKYKIGAGSIKVYEKDSANNWVELLGEISGESGEKGISDSHSHVSSQEFPDMSIISLYNYSSETQGFFDDTGEILDVGPDKSDFPGFGAFIDAGSYTWALGAGDTPLLYDNAELNYSWQTSNGGGAYFDTPAGIVGNSIAETSITMAAACTFRSFGSQYDAYPFIQPPIINIGFRGANLAFAIRQLHIDDGTPSLLRDWDMIGVTYGPTAVEPPPYEYHKNWTGAETFSVNQNVAQPPTPPPGGHQLAPFFVRAGEPHWYVVTKDGHIVSFYVDGQLISSYDFTAEDAAYEARGADAIPSAAIPVYGTESWIGTQRTPGRGSSINGIIRDVGVWTGALTAAEIAYMYTAGNNGETVLIDGLNAPLVYSRFQTVLSLGQNAQLAKYNSVRYGGAIDSKWNQPWNQYGGIDFITNYFSVSGGTKHTDNDLVYTYGRETKYDQSNGEGLGWSISMSGDGNDIISGAPYMSTIGATVAVPRRSYREVGRAYAYKLKKIQKSIQVLPKRPPGKIKMTIHDAAIIVNDAQKRLNHDITDFFNIPQRSSSDSGSLNWTKQWDTVPDKAVNPPKLEDYTNPYWAKSNLKPKVSIPLSKIIKTVELQVGTQIWQTLTQDDIAAINATEMTESAYKSLGLQCSGLVRSDGTRETFGDAKWIPGKKYQAIIPIPILTGNNSGKFQNYKSHRHDGYLNCLAREQEVKIKIKYANVEDIFHTEDLYAYQGYEAPIYTGFDSINKGKYITNVPELWNPKIKLQTKLYGEYITLAGEEKDALKASPDRIYKKIKSAQNITFDKLPEVLHRDAYVDIKLDEFSIYSSHLIISLDFPGITNKSNIPYLDSADIILNGTTHSGIVKSNSLLAAAKSLGLYSNELVFDKDNFDKLFYVFPLASRAFGGSSIPLNRFDDVILRIIFSVDGGIPDEGINVPIKSKVSITCRGETNLYYHEGSSAISLF